MTPIEAAADVIRQDFYDGCCRSSRNVARACLTAAVEALSDGACRCCVMEGNDWSQGEVGNAKPEYFRTELIKQLTKVLP